jgi:hypothetical protein
VNEEKERWAGLMGWVVIKCLHCRNDYNLRDYHHSYRMQINDRVHKRVIPPCYLLTCPKCNKDMELNYTVKKERKIKNEPKRKILQKMRRIFSFKSKQ